MKKYLFILCCTLCLDLFGQIPFENNIYEETCTIPVVKLNDGEKDVFFLVDTGTTLSIINKCDNKYETVSIKNYHIYTIYSEIVCNARICRITINGVRQSIIENNINYLLDRYKSLGYNVIGILGTDFLRARKAIIDYNKRVLIINN